MRQLAARYLGAIFTTALLAGCAGSPIDFTSSTGGANSVGGNYSTGATNSTGGYGTTGTCGNGVVDTTRGEVCDDGNNVDGDGCSANCRSNETCGNGIVDAAKGEVCDNGTANGSALDGKYCSSDCRSNGSCGNDITDTALGEVCDNGTANGSTLGGQYCSFDCKSNGTCGNGIVDTVVGEVCDDGSLNGTMAHCSADCKSTGQCGNGVWDQGEECDYCTTTDGGAPTTGGGGTTTGEGGGSGDAGTSGSICPLGISETATCNHNCRIARCGDGYVNAAAGEVCDTSGGADTATCNGNQAPPAVACHAPVCGDGYVNTAAGEICDTAGDNSACNGSRAPSGAACHAPICGDNYVNAAAGETCDSASGANAATCNGNQAPANVACHAAICGDGYVNAAAGETCDCGPTSSLGCNASCRVVPGFTCTSSAPSKCTAICGDGIVAASEACDDFNALSCGTCNATCSAVQAPRSATGTITSVAGSYYAKGDSFTISDGVDVPVIFEFSNSGVSTPTHVFISFGVGDDAAVMAARISSAINGVGAPLSVSAAVNNSAASQVLLIDASPGATGNVAILVSAASMLTNAGFKVDGLSGGLGYDCSAGTGCVANEDCRSSVCTNHLCEP